MLRKILPLFFILIFLFLLIPAGEVSAQLPPFSGPIVPCGIGVGGVGAPFACDACDLLKLAQRLINFFIFFAVFVAVMMFIYAGFLYITAAGNQSQVSRAHKIFWYVLIGFIIILAAWLLIDFLMKAFYKDSGFGPWNEILCA